MGRIIIRPYNTMNINNLKKSRMKKLFFTLTLLVSVFALSAQKYVVTEKETGNVVENGANYYVYGEGNDFEELVLELLVTANENVNLIAEAEVIQAVEGTYNTICLESCYAPGTTTTPVVPFAAGESKDFAMHYMYSNTMEEVLGMEQIMKYSLYEEGSHEMFIVNVIFKYSLDDVEENSIVKTFSNAYPVPAKDVVNFDYNFRSNVNEAYVAIYNMMGQEVMRSEISALQGKVCLNVSDLADGVYFYSLIVNGKTEKSSKLVVRH